MVVHEIGPYLDDFDSSAARGTVDFSASSESDVRGIRRVSTARRKDSTSPRGSLQQNQARDTTLTSASILKSVKDRLLRYESIDTKHLPRRRRQQTTGRSASNCPD